jgi:hypothetical protein
VVSYKRNIFFIEECSNQSHSLETIRVTDSLLASSPSVSKSADLPIVL